MTAPRSTLASAALASVLVVAFARAAHGAPRPLRDALPPEARADYLQGRALFADGDAAGARVKFAQAYARAKEPRLLWNEAVCEKSLRHYARVRALVAQYLAEGGALLTAADRAEAQELAKAIEPFTTALAIQSSEAGAEVTVDGEAAGVTPLPTPIVVDIGAHDVTVAKPGFRPWSARVSVGERRAESLVATLLPSAGAVEVRAPAGAEVAVDGAVVGKGTVAVPLAVGGHAVRVTAPGFLPYESDVVVEDATTRSLDVTLVRDARNPRSAELRVAVGCGDASPLTQSEGLDVLVDGAPAGAGDIVFGYDEVRGERAVDFVRLRVTPGKHVVRAAFPGCVASETRIVASDDSPAMVRGSLDRAEREMRRGPAGTPNGWRVSFSGVADALSLPAGSGSYGVQTGGAGAAGLVTRWFTGSIVIGVASGSITYSDGTVYSAQHVYAHIRAGLRVPLHAIAIAAGTGFGFETITSVTGGAVVPLWGSVDLHPLCEWAVPLTALWSHVPGTDGTVAFEVGLAYQPNTACRREEATVHGL